MREAQSIQRHVDFYRREATLADSVEVAAMYRKAADLYEKRLTTAHETLRDTWGPSIRCEVQNGK